MDNIPFLEQYIVSKWDLLPTTINNEDYINSLIKPFTIDVFSEMHDDNQWVTELIKHKVNVYSTIYYNYYDKCNDVYKNLNIDEIFNVTDSIGFPEINTNTELNSWWTDCKNKNMDESVGLYQFIQSTISTILPLVIDQSSKRVERRKTKDFDKLPFLLQFLLLVSEHYKAHTKNILSVHVLMLSRNYLLLTAYFPDLNKINYAQLLRMDSTRSEFKVQFIHEWSRQYYEGLIHVAQGKIYPPMTECNIERKMYDSINNFTDGLDINEISNWINVGNRRLDKKIISVQKGLFPVYKALSKYAGEFQWRTLYVEAIKRFKHGPYLEHPLCLNTNGELTCDDLSSCTWFDCCVMHIRPYLTKRSRRDIDTKLLCKSLVNMGSSIFGNHTTKKFWTSDQYGVNGKTKSIDNGPALPVKLPLYFADKPLEHENDKKVKISLKGLYPKYRNSVHVFLDSDLKCSVHSPINKDEALMIRSILIRTFPTYFYTYLFNANRDKDSVIKAAKPDYVIYNVNGTGGSSTINKTLKRVDRKYNEKIVSSVLEQIEIIKKQI